MPFELPERHHGLGTAAVPLPFLNSSLAHWLVNLLAAASCGCGRGGGWRCEDFHKWAVGHLDLEPCELLAPVDPDRVIFSQKGRECFSPQYLLFQFLKLCVVRSLLRVPVALLFLQKPHPACEQIWPDVPSRVRTQAPLSAATRLPPAPPFVTCSRFSVLRRGEPSKTC